MRVMLAPPSQACCEGLLILSVMPGEGHPRNQGCLQGAPHKSVQRGSVVQRLQLNLGRPTNLNPKRLLLLRT